MLEAAGRNIAASANFLAGGGEVGARLRALDWSHSPLGLPETWPQSLKTIVRVMLDSRYAMWMLWGPEFTFFCNDAYLPTVGLKRDWVLGARSDSVWKEIWSDIGPRIERVLEHGQATWDEGLLLFLERSGFPEETYHTFSYSPVYDDENRITGMLCVVTEVTERVIGERRLRALSDLAAPLAGAEGVEARCLRACEVLARYPFDVPFGALYLLEPGGRRATRVSQTRPLPEDQLPLAIDADAASTRWPIAALLDTEAPQLVESLSGAGITLAAGPWPDLVQQAILLPLPGAAAQGLAGFLLIGASPRRPFDDAYRSFLDLVGRQVGAAVAEAQTYEAERRRAEALAEIDRAKTAFFSNVSHEFRTPLTLMLGPLESALDDAQLPPERRVHLELAHRNAERLRKLVNSLLDFSRIEAGRMQAAYEPTDLAAFTRDLASTFRSAMERAALSFAVDTEPLEEPVYIDREMWEKIVLNLLSNALKFTLQGSVSVRLTSAAAHAVLDVTDTGVGVPEHEVPRLFERFHRVEGSHGRTHEGSGIGLALVQELVRLHGGHVEASSELGVGTSFCVRVPFGKQHLPADRVKPSREGPSALLGAQAFVQEAFRWLENTTETSSQTLAAFAESSFGSSADRFATTFGSRIVLADDNADMRHYMMELLKPFYAVETCSDGAQALAATRKTRPDLILSDVMMPNLDGFALLAEIRADQDLRNMPVVLLSARAGEEARIEGLDAGADDYLIKPFSARELLARVGALLELTQMRKAADEAFRLRTAQFETLLREAPLGVYLIDADFRIREANPTALRVFGDVPDLIGSDFAQAILRLWPPAFVDEVVGLFRHTLNTGEPYFTPERIEQRADTGVVEYYEWQINRIPLPDGSFGVVCYFRDISAHVQARRLLETADRQKDEFLAMLAHELRNPLAPIRNAAEVLAHSQTQNAVASKAIEIVQRQVGNLARLVDDLLDVSRITLGRIELKLRAVNVNDLVAQALEIVDPLVRKKKHTVTVTARGTPRVNGDPARIVQCIANVLTNAAKYTDPGGEIRVESKLRDSEVVITIGDNGVGIASELLPHLFKLFVQSKRTLDRSQGGLGIGLSVVQRLIEMHGGQIAARSDGIGKGSTFEIRLPSIDRAEEPAAAARLAPVEPRRVLVVDDNEDAANTLAMMLSLDGHAVRTVYSARQALDELARFAPDVVLLDIGLPEMDGYEVARRIREQYGREDIRLVAVTGYGQQDDRQRARAAGFDDHLIKPVEMGLLTQALAGTVH